MPQGSPCSVWPRHKYRGTAEDCCHTPVSVALWGRVGLLACPTPVFVAPAVVRREAHVVRTVASRAVRATLAHSAGDAGVERAVHGDLRLAGTMAQDVGRTALHAGRAYQHADVGRPRGEGGQHVAVGIKEGHLVICAFSNAMAELTVKNFRLPILPTTVDMGTALITIGGVALMAIAVGALVRARAATASTAQRAGKRKAMPRRPKGRRGILLPETALPSKTPLRLRLVLEVSSIKPSRPSANWANVTKNCPILAQVKLRRKRSGVLRPTSPRGTPIPAKTPPRHAKAPRRMAPTGRRLCGGRYKI